MDETVRGRADLVERYAGICHRMQGERARWIAWLRAYGIKAAHPDDGWVTRNTNMKDDGSRRDWVELVYPMFDDGVVAGDLIALGWPDRFRVVRVTAVRSRGFLWATTVYEFAP